LKIQIDGKEYPFDPDALTFDEACDLEGIFGGTFGEFGQALRKTSMNAIRAFVFILQRRDNPALRLGDVGGTVLGTLKFIKDPEDVKAEATAEGTVQRDEPDFTPTDSEPQGEKSEV
jgi:hypothetical protein